MTSDFAPIALFVYNRPLHTLQTLEALAKNELASVSILYIFSDGPKEGTDEKTIEQINETRKIIRQKNWCKEVIIKEHKTNKGLADSIIGGVSEIIEKHGKIIVLEDDIVTSPGFLRFMNDALTLYQNETRVWHISGYWYPIKENDLLPETFFLTAATCWGWATWKRAWVNLITDTEKLNQRILEQPNGILRFNMDGAYPFYDQLQANLQKKIKTWAVKWYGSIFINKALSLHPNNSLVNNIGLDKTGVNCDESVLFNWDSVVSSVDVKNIPIAESVLSRSMLKPFFKKALNPKQVTSLKKAKNEVKNFIKNYLDKKGIKISKLRKDSFSYLKDLPRYQPVDVPLNGKNFLAADAMSFYYSYKEIFETGVYKFISNTETPLIIDCGCNYGTSILFFKTMYPQAEIIAFEPDPFIYKIAAQNVATYELKNVSLHNKGLWEEETTLVFYSEKADGGRLEVLDKKTDIDTVEIQTAVLSKFIKDRKVDFLKIDIEGAEVKVLLECQEYLDNVSNLFIEYHSFVNKQQDLDIILSVLKNKGFRYQLERIGALKNPFIDRQIKDDMDLQVNIFAYK